MTSSHFINVSLYGEPSNLLKGRKIGENYKFGNVTIRGMEAHNFDPNTYQHNLTIVSAYYDMKRDGRGPSVYFQWLKNTFKLNAPFIFFTQSKFKDKILNLVPKTTPIFFVIIEFEDLPYYKDYNLVNEIIHSNEYKSKMPYSGRLECVNPGYPVVIFSKFTVMEISIPR